MKNYRTKVDFDKWSELAKSDPQAFEQLRSQFLNNALSRINISKRHQFECLQWRLDSIRQTSKTPLSACIKMTQLMWSSFDELHQQYYYDSNPVAVSNETKKKAKVLPFHQARR